MVTYSISIPICGLAAVSAVVGAILLSIGVIYALAVITAPHGDGSVIRGGKEEI